MAGTSPAMTKWSGLWWGLGDDAPHPARARLAGRDLPGCADGVLQGGLVRIPAARLLDRLLRAILRQRAVADRDRQFVHHRLGLHGVYLAGGAAGGVRL